LHHYNSQQPVTRKSEAVLKEAVRRADWELRNDDIQLHQKIGSVSSSVTGKAIKCTFSQRFYVKSVCCMDGPVLIFCQIMDPVFAPNSSYIKIFARLDFH